MRPARRLTVQTRAMATKAISGSATWMRAMPLAAMFFGTTTAEAPAIMQQMGVLIGFEKGNVAGARFLQGSGGPDRQIAVAQGFAVHEFRQLRKAETHARTSFLP